MCTMNTYLPQSGTNKCLRLLALKVCVRVSVASMYTRFEVYAKSESETVTERYDGNVLASDAPLLRT